MSRVLAYTSPALGHLMPAMPILEELRPTRSPRSPCGPSPPRSTIAREQRPVRGADRAGDRSDRARRLAGANPGRRDPQRGRRLPRAAPSTTPRTWSGRSRQSARTSSWSTSSPSGRAPQPRPGAARGPPTAPFRPRSPPRDAPPTGLGLRPARGAARPHAGRPAEGLHRTGRATASLLPRLNAQRGGPRARRRSRTSGTCTSRRRCSSA